jgi:hypothetical protein
MNDEFDPLERELQSLRPGELSPQLQQRIGEALAGDSPALSSYRVRWPFALAGALAASALVLLILGRGREDAIRLNRDPTQSLPVESRSAQVANDTPTLWVYEQALADSPEAFDALFDKQGRMATQVGATRPPARAFSWSERDLTSWIGEF